MHIVPATERTTQSSEQEIKTSWTTEILRAQETGYRERPTRKEAALKAYLWNLACGVLERGVLGVRGAGCGTE